MYAASSMSHGDADAVSFNQNLVDLSDGAIPPLTALRYLSVGGGHTNSFLRAVIAGCKTSVASLQDDSGRLNGDKLSAGRSAFQTALTEGLTWLVMDGRPHHHHAQMPPPPPCTTTTKPQPCTTACMFILCMLHHTSFVCGRRQRNIHEHVVACICK